MDKEIEIPIDQIKGHLVPEIPLFLSKIMEMFIAILGREEYCKLILFNLKNSIASDLVECALAVQISVIKEDWELVDSYLTLLQKKWRKLFYELHKDDEVDWV